MDVGIRDLRNGLSRHLDAVKAGEVITVTDHGHPIARITPIDAPSPLDRLIAEGRVTPARVPRAELPEPVKIEGTVSDLIADQRR